MTPSQVRAKVATWAACGDNSPPFHTLSAPTAVSPTRARTTTRAVALRSRRKENADASADATQPALGWSSPSKGPPSKGGLTCGGADPFGRAALAT
jgi:hypothetical protein